MNLDSDLNQIFKVYKEPVNSYEILSHNLQPNTFK